MPYRVCKMFEIETGHMLSKHPGRCRFPHGHSRRVEVVIASGGLDEADMVCDFKAIKLALARYLDALDHAMAINSADERLDTLRAMSDRVIVFEDEDPTTEALARKLYEELRTRMDDSEGLRDPETGVVYRFAAGLRIERVRVWETPSSWAEYVGDE